MFTGCFTHTQGREGTNVCMYLYTVFGSSANTGPTSKTSRVRDFVE